MNTDNIKSIPPTLLNISWSELFEEEVYKDYSVASLPNNPQCKIKNPSCSLKMAKDDLCFWHSKRMGRKGIIRCECREFTGILTGDSIGRCLAREYYDLDPNTTPIGWYDRTYCCGPCGNSDSNKYTCGDMLIGDCCKKYHHHLNKPNCSLPYHQFIYNEEQVKKFLELLFKDEEIYFMEIIARSKWNKSL